MKKDEWLRKTAFPTLPRINVVFEQYPDLKANQNVLQLQEEIVNTENKLAYAKQAYNDTVERYEAKKKSFFEAMIVNFFLISWIKLMSTGRFLRIK